MTPEQPHTSQTWVVVAAPIGYRAKLLGRWVGPMRETLREAFVDGDFTDLPYRFGMPPAALIASCIEGAE